MPQTAFVYDPVFLKHETGADHPESPKRLRAILDRLESTGMMSKLLRLIPAPAPVEAITRIHTADYVEHIAEMSRRGGHFYEGPDTAGSSATYQAAIMAAGAVICATDCVMRGDAVNAFCAVRPPGHHAELSEAMGFCFFNNIAIGARHLQAHHGIKRVAIIDWDVHHGNGTQHSFYADPSVLYFSIHQWPHYPGTGRQNEAGEQDGKGHTINVPVAAGSTDTDFINAFTHTLRPAIDRFRPDFILISAGFDAHTEDPLSNTMVTAEGFAEMTRAVSSMAAIHCKSRIVSVLEGGYSLGPLADSVEAHLKVLMNHDGDGPADRHE